MKTRIKISVGYSAKKTTVSKIENNEFFKIFMLSSNRNHDNGWDIFFTVKTPEDCVKAEEFCKSHKLNFTKLNE